MSIHDLNLRKCSFIILTLLVVIGSPYPVGAAQHNPEKSPTQTSDSSSLETTEPLVFLAASSLPPMSYWEDGQWKGLVVDLANAIVRHIPYPVNIEYMNWATAQQLVLENQADALLYINPTEDRKLLYDFSDDFLDSEISIFVKINRSDIFDIESLSNLNVGVLNKGLAFNVLKQKSLIKLVTFSEILPAFHMLAKGELDAVVMDQHVGGYLLAKHNISDVKITGSPIDRSVAAIAVTKGESETLAAINHALTTIKENGTYAEILARWHPKEIVFQTREQASAQRRSIIMLSTIVGVAIVLVLFAYVWNKSLTRKVSHGVAELQKINSSLLTEIEERERAEHSARVSDQRFKDFMMSANEACVLYDSNFILKDMNDKALELFPEGTVQASLVGLHILEIAPTLKESGRFELYEDVLKTGNPIEFKDLVPDPVFGDRFLSVKAFRVGEGLGLIVSDTTDRKRTEDELRYHAAILQHVTDAVFSFDPELKILTWNEGAEKIYGWRPDEVIGQSLWDIMKPEPPDTSFSDMQLSIDQGEFWEKKVTQIVKSGINKTIHLRVTDITDEAGKTTSYVGVGHDISEQIAANDLLIDYQNRLKALAFKLTLAGEKERKSIASDLHDNVAQALALLRMEVATVMKRSSDQATLPLLKEISETLLKTLNETRNLMSDLSSPSMNEIGLRAAISEWLEKNIGERHKIKTELIDNTNSNRNLFNEDEKIILFRNVRELLVNTVKHARANEVSVIFDSDQFNRKISVVDDGVGFDFLAISGYKKDKEKGYGLFSVEERMYDLEGSVEIKSSPGNGTTIVLTLPSTENLSNKQV